MGPSSNSLKLFNWAANTSICDLITFFCAMTISVCWLTFCIALWSKCSSQPTWSMLPECSNERKHCWIQNLMLSRITNAFTVHWLHPVVEAGTVSHFEVCVVRDDLFGSTAIAAWPVTSSPVQTVELKGILTGMSAARVKQLRLLVMAAIDDGLSAMVHAESLGTTESMWTISCSAFTCRIWDASERLAMSTPFGAPFSSYPPLTMHSLHTHHLSVAQAAGIEN